MRKTYEAYVDIGVTECSIHGCHGFEWVFMYEDISLDPFHCCDAVMPSAISNHCKQLTGYTLEEFRLLAFTFSKFEEVVIPL